MPEGEKFGGGGAVVMSGDNLPTPGWNRAPLSPTAPPGSGILLVSIYLFEPKRSCAVHKSAFKKNPHEFC